VAGGIYALKHLPLDGHSDLSDTQVIVYTNYPGQAPQVVEDQVTYPLSTAIADRAQIEGGAGFLVSSACPSSILFSKMAPTSTGREAVSWNIERRRNAPAYWGDPRRSDLTPPASAGSINTLSPSKILNLGETRLPAGLDHCVTALAKAEGVAEVASVWRLRQTI